MGYAGRGVEVEKISQEGFCGGLGRDPSCFQAQGGPLHLAGSMFLHFSLNQ